MENYPILFEEQASHGNTLFPCAVYEITAAFGSTEKIYCHWHHELELLLILEGNATLHIGSQSYPVQAGDFAWIPSNAVHMVLGEPDMPFRFIAIVFHPDLLKSFGNDIIQENYLSPLFHWQFDCPPVTKDAGRYRRLMRSIASHYRQKTTGYELLIKTRLFDICFQLYQTAQPFQRSQPDTSDYHMALAKEMMLYLQSYATDTITLSDMADHFHISTGHLCRLFKAMTNMSPIDYLNYFRINKSARLLRDTDASISAIAGQTGFNTISYFNRMFRRYMHMTPKEYRNSQM